MTDARDVTTLLREGVYTAVGFGVVAFQKAQVQRTELTKRLDTETREAREQLTRLGKDIEREVRSRIDSFTRAA